MKKILALVFIFLFSSIVSAEPTKKEFGFKNIKIEKMAAATKVPFYLSTQATTVTLEIHRPKDFLRASKKHRQVWLAIRNFASYEHSPMYDVYLNVPQGDEPKNHPDLRVDSLAPYGMVEATRAYHGIGLNFNIDVTALYDRLRALPDWDIKNLRVSFLPSPWNGQAHVRVQSVGLYFE